MGYGVSAQPSFCSAQQIQPIEICRDRHQRGQARIRPELVCRIPEPRHHGPTGLAPVPAVGNTKLAENTLEGLSLAQLSSGLGIQGGYCGRSITGVPLQCKASLDHSCGNTIGEIFRELN